MKIAVPKETLEGETRVALVPELVGRLTGLGHVVAVEPGAGVAADIHDDDYVDAGSWIDPDALTDADLVLAVNPPATSVLRTLRAGTTMISFLPVTESPDLVADLRDLDINAYAMDLVPRISRAQSMDAVTSQSMVAGYRSAIVAAGLLRKFFPLNMTAAGTIEPARVLVLGAGVAGLQAIATAKRLGADVQAYDVRSTSAEEIRSVGATALDLGLEPLEGVEGYARAMSEERAARQRELLAPHVARADALITTAAVPGQPAPLLVTADMVAQMKPGSVVVDLAADSGGNVEGAVAGKIVRTGGAQIWGGRNVAAQLPGPASRLYAHNIVNLVTLMTRDAEFAPDHDDEILAACAVTRNGQIVHGPTRALVEGPELREDAQ